MIEEETLLLALEHEAKQSKWQRSGVKDLQGLWTGLNLPSSKSSLRHATAHKRGCALYYKHAQSLPLVLGRARISKNDIIRYYRQRIWEGTSRINRPERYVSAFAYNPISVSYQRLLNLLTEKGEDDYGRVDPTQFAFKTASEFILNAEWMLGHDIKSSSVVDSEGGIRTTWACGDRKVKLICPATPNSSVYIYESSPMGGVVHDQGVTFLVLAKRLSWLLHGDKSYQSSE
jgi:hypothetical protein